MANPQFLLEKNRKGDFPVNLNFLENQSDKGKENRIYIYIFYPLWIKDYKNDKEIF